MKIKNTFLAMITGIGIGIPVTLICMTLIGGYNDVLREFLVWTVASALFGVLSVLTFSNEKMNLILSTVIHCAGCLLITLVACVINGYINGVVEFLLAIVPVFVVVYAVIYLATFISMKKSAKQANDALNNKMM